MKKVVVFGATGHTGAYFVEHCMENLEKNEFEIVAVGRRQTDFFSKKGIEYYSVDITDAYNFGKLPQENIHTAVNLAAILPAYMEGYKPEQYIRINVMGALNILEYCRRTGADRILYPQSVHDIVGHWGKGILIKPDFPRKFKYTGDHAVYIIAKNAAVDLAEHYHQEYGLKNFIFRTSTVYLYTPNQYFYVDGVRRILGYRHLMNQAMAGEPIEMWGDPQKAKDWVYIKDFCQMFCKAITVDRESGFYNVGTGTTVTLKEAIEGIIEVFSPADKKSKIISRPDMPDGRDFVMDISNARKELGYQPQYFYLDFLKDFKKEWELNRFAELRNEDREQ